VRSRWWLFVLFLLCIHIPLAAQPCTPATASQPAPGSGDTLFIDDALPGSAYFQGGTAGLPVWDTAQAASGTQSIRHADAGEIKYEGYIRDLSVPIEFGENALAYFLINECRPTREVKLTWTTWTGASGSAYWGESLIGGESSSIDMGALPAAGTWHRVEIPFNQLGLELQTLWRVTIASYGGQVFFDGFGKSGAACIAPTAASPAPPAGETIWIDDALPAGAALQNGSWGPPSWTTDQAASGTQSLRFAYNGARHYEGYIANLNEPLSFGESVVFSMLVHPCATTREVKIVWDDTLGGSGGAYWGEAITGGEGGYLNMGPVPAAGTWQRIEIPLSQLGLEQRTLGRIRIVHHGGQVSFDRFGKSGTACVAPRAAAPTIPAGETIWVDESVPAGASLQNGYWGPQVWSLDQSASGTKSLRFPYNGARHYESYITNLNEPLQFGENAVFYFHVDPCLTTREVKVVWDTWSGATAGVYFGEALTGGENGFINLGPMPAAGVWHRVEVPLSQLGIEQTAVWRIRMVHHGGQVSFDRFGKSGTACVAPRASAPAIPSGETIWVDDSVPAGASLQNGYWGPPVWSTDQSASGAASLRFAYAGARHYESYITNLNEPLHVGEKAVFYFHLDPCLTTREVKVLWDTWSGATAGVYFGEALTGGENGLVNLGPLPAAGVWHRVEVPLSQLGLEQTSLWRIRMVHHSGQVSFDRFGKTGAACVMPASVAQPTATYSIWDWVWVDDALPPGASLQNGYYGPPTWDPAQSASGTQSLKFEYSGDHVYESYINGLDHWTAYNEEFFTYVLVNPCAPPREIRILWWSSHGQTAGAYWGEALMGSEQNYKYMGPIPAGGEWVRLVIPTRDIVMEDRAIVRMSLGYHSGQVWFDRIGLGGDNWCAHPWDRSGDLTDAGDTLFIENAIPAGASYQSGIYGPFGPIVPGSRVIGHSYWGNVKYESSIEGLNVPLTADQNIAFSMVTNGCVPPREVRLLWYATDGSRGGAYWGESTNFGDETQANMIDMGALPPIDVWTRMEIPINALGLAGKTLSRIVFGHQDGQVWFERFATQCAMTRKPAPAFGATEVPFLDDALPAGASLQNGTRGPNSWNTRQSVSGTRSLSFRYAGQQHYEGYVRDLDIPLEIGENLVFYALFHECNTPRELKVMFDSTLGDTAGVYWGEALTGSEASLINMGAIPAAGVWHRIEIPLATLGLEQRRLGRIRIIVHSGQAWLDRFGKSGVACVAAPNGAQPAIPAGDTVWVDDSLPAGASLMNGYRGPVFWDSSQAASGTKSLRNYYYGANMAYESYVAGLNGVLDFGQDLIAYIRINECAIPREVRLIWYTSDGGSAGAYFGEALAGGEAGMVNLGPVPAAGVWHRVSVPAETLGFEQRTISRIALGHYGGQVWFDHLGVAGTACVTAPPRRRRASPPATTSSSTTRSPPARRSSPATATRSGTARRPRAGRTRSATRTTAAFTTRATSPISTSPSRRTTRSSSTSCRTNASRRARSR
jgi:hypothetical protein